MLFTFDQAWSSTLTVVNPSGSHFLPWPICYILDRDTQQRPRIQLNPDPNSVVPETTPEKVLAVSPRTSIPINQLWNTSNKPEFLQLKPLSLNCLNSILQPRFVSRDCNLGCVDQKPGRSHVQESWVIGPYDTNLAIACLDVCWSQEVIEPGGLGRIRVGPLSSSRICATKRNLASPTGAMSTSA